MIMAITLFATSVGLTTAKAGSALMAAILGAAAAYFRSSSMVNSITAVQWMDTGKNGAPPPMISEKTESGDCVSINGILFRPEFFSSRAFLSFLLLSFEYYKGSGTLGKLHHKEWRSHILWGFGN